ncbi:MAG: hypothetical protein CR986_01220 [Ignavibacteriae bacterium]|nr:MAG: hypothetical protein CR986_01220 [Ignavibacteriota bacterium]
MKIKLLILLLLTTFTYGQKIDSLFNLFVSAYGNIAQGRNSAEEKITKCGFPLQAAMRNNYEKFSNSQQLQLESYFDRPDLQTSIVSPNGFFRIHYDTTGRNAPAYGNLTVAQSVKEIAIAFDSAYTFQVEYLGYPPPPPDNNKGGDNLYDVYIKFIGAYGLTTADELIVGDKYTSYIEINNSFSGSSFSTNGIKAARVTAAHEFHHAIQIGNYMLPRLEDIYYAELTSTAFEEFIYDDVNDYYHYMSNLFNFTSKKFEEHNGYDLALWNIFLYQKFKADDPMLGHNIVKKSWEYLVEERAIIAIAKALSFYGYSFGNLFSEFAVWLYFTNHRAIENKYFEEAKFYPLVKPTNKYNLNKNIMPITCLTKPVSMNYLLFTNSHTDYNDSITAIFTNTDVEGSITNSTGINISFNLAEKSINGGVKINKELNYYVKLTADKKKYISDSYIINNKLAAEFVPQAKIDFVYPQPFNYTDYENLHFPTNNDQSGVAELYIYSINMELVFYEKLQIPNSGNTVVTWNALDNNNNKLAGGVYIYVTKTSNNIKKGKFVILNK